MYGCMDIWMCCICVCVCCLLAYSFPGMSSATCIDTSMSIQVIVDEDAIPIVPEWKLKMVVTSPEICLLEVKGLFVCLVLRHRVVP